MTSTGWIETASQETAIVAAFTAALIAAATVLYMMRRRNPGGLQGQHAVITGGSEGLCIFYL